MESGGTFDKIVLVLILVAATWLARIIIKARRTSKREAKLRGIIKATPNQYFDVVRVAREMNLSTTEARTVINSLRGDQSWGWAISNYPDPLDGGIQVYSSASSDEWRYSPR